MSIPAVQLQVVISLVLNIFALLVEMTLLIGALFMYFLKFVKPDTYLHFELGVWIRFRVLGHVTRTIH